MYDHKSYLIETLTNTHVGGDDTGFSVADKVIQKDPVTENSGFSCLKRQRSLPGSSAGIRGRRKRSTTGKRPHQKAHV